MKGLRNLARPGNGTLELNLRSMLLVPEMVLLVCRDKGEEGYERYVALAVLGRNLQTLGTILQKKELKRIRRQSKAA